MKREKQQNLTRTTSYQLTINKVKELIPVTLSIYEDDIARIEKLNEQILDAKTIMIKHLENHFDEDEIRDPDVQQAIRIAVLRDSKPNRIVQYREFFMTYLQASEDLTLAPKSIDFGKTVADLLAKAVLKAEKKVNASDIKVKEATYSNKKFIRLINRQSFTMYNSRRKELICQGK